MKTIIIIAIFLIGITACEKEQKPIKIVESKPDPIIVYIKDSIEIYAIKAEWRIPFYEKKPMSNISLKI